MKRRDDIRNVAIIAHVDHGKTTLVDAMLRQSGQYRASQLQGERILDSNDLERERGITILAKNIAIKYGDTKINLIDTPGHADFGGEVERTLQMADGALVLVDAFEGPDAADQVRASQGFCPPHPADRGDQQDRPPRRPAGRGLERDLRHVRRAGGQRRSARFSVYLRIRKGRLRVPRSPRDLRRHRPLFDMIIDHVPGPVVDPDGPFRMLCTTLDFSEYVGRIAVGRIVSGRVKRGQKAVLMKARDKSVAGSIDSVLVFDKLGRTEVESAEAGDIVAIVGLGSVDIGDTIADPENPVACRASKSISRP